MTPKTNNSNTNQTCRLSVQISLTGLSFLVSSENDEAIHFVEKDFDQPNTPEELLAEIIEVLNLPEFQQHYSRVSLVYSTNTYSAVPAAIFEEQKASEYLKFNTKILSNDFISHDVIDGYDLVIVYVPLININNYIFDRFGSFEYYHAVSLLLRQCLTAEKFALDTKVYLHIQRSQFECIIMKKGELLLCNSYPYTTPEDFIYYVLFCLEQLKINPDTVITLLCGAVTIEDPNYNMLYNYIRNVKFFSPITTPLKQEATHEHLLHKLLA
ncbi:MAG: DUF3822 family protein [Bacteroidetes bacterium]|nr:DUF3822 family protein [Bacteroidota bacterium]